MPLVGQSTAEMIVASSTPVTAEPYRSNRDIGALRVLREIAPGKVAGSTIA